jgi:2-polyprenyl-6-methoxyphenol hydroxylase-like FAD-dependent oxidoreductase
MADYDLITVGGGLAGSAVAKVMADAGARVLMLEQERRFRDRVRGEALVPWGVAEARTLGLEAALLEGGACIVPHWTLYAGSQVQQRDLPTTTPSRAGCLNYYHLALQETLIDLAQTAGAEVRPGATVTGVTPGQPACVTVGQDHRSEPVTAGLVVGADGRDSKVRSWAGFTVRRDPPHLLIAGLLFEGMTVADDSAHLFTPPTFGEMALLLPQGHGRVRVYSVTARRAERGRLSGAARIGDFIRACIECGVPADWLRGATPCGPLASFEAASSWVDHPYRDGVVLVGDAAAATDPTFGQGQSLTLRDVRVLSELLRASDWETAARRYATEHDRYFGALHTIEGWLARIIFTLGPEGDRIRAQAVPALRQGLGPDHIGLGPEAPADEATRQRLFGH